jgi:hypothetical protein
VNRGELYRGVGVSEYRRNTTVVIARSGEPDEGDDAISGWIQFQISNFKNGGHCEELRAVTSDVAISGWIRLQSPNFKFKKNP